MRTISFIITIVLSACAYPNTPINTPFDNDLRYQEIEGRAVETSTNRAELVVCIDESSTHRAELLEIANYASNWWNSWLSEDVGCLVFEVNPNESGPLFCDVHLRVGTSTFGADIVTNLNISAGTRTTGLFRNGEIVLQENVLRNRRIIQNMAVHEFGHILSLADDEGRMMAQVGSVMSHPLPLNVRPTHQDLRTLKGNLTCH